MLGGNMFKHLSSVAAAALLAGCAAPGETGKAVGEGLTSFMGKLSTDLDNATRSIGGTPSTAAPGARQASAPPPGKRLQDTVLKGMFARYPIDGSKPAPRFNGELWYPRVALVPVTVPSVHNKGWGDNASASTTLNGVAVTGYDIGAKAPDYARICWTFRARIWTSASKSSDTPEFLYCASDAMPRVRLGGALRNSVYDNIWMSKTQSGSLFTQGPRQPKMAVGANYAGHTQFQAGYYGAHVLLALMEDMGIDPYDENEGNRVWVADAAIAVKDF